MHPVGVGFHCLDAVFGKDVIFIRIIQLDAFDLRFPNAVALRHKLHLVGVVGPVVKIADDRNAHGVRRPHAEHHRIGVFPMCTEIGIGLRIAALVKQIQRYLVFGGYCFRLLRHIHYLTITYYGCIVANLILFFKCFLTFLSKT